MRQGSIEIGTPGIRKALNKYSPMSAIAEFIWNGFDAGADLVDIQYDANELGYINALRIVDNGSGIDYSELGKKFKPFLHTNKVFDPDETHYGPSARHGKNGIGRLTFFKFAERAIGTTVYKVKLDGFREYSIEINRRCCIKRIRMG